jgi:NAD(P)-dependent dehydrogenase (short-subunit alcohol dehydrogenase family)
LTRLVAITGIAGGIGAATATVFHDAGWSVAGVDLVGPPSATPMEAFTTLDLRESGAGDALAGFFATLSGVDALVNAAAIQGIDRIDATPVAAWDEVIEANARGTFLAMQAAYPHLRRSHGAVVNVASVHAFATAAGAGPYAASKGAIVAMTRAGAIEWAPEVRVNAVAPGAVDTNMLRQGVQRWASAEGVDAALDGLAARTPLGRIGRPDEIAEVILFLADSRRSSFITGQVVVADGGALARLSTE